MIIGIDASNIRSGGGLTHLIALLSYAKPTEHGISKIVVWSSAKTASALPDRPYLTKINPKVLNRGGLRRALWRIFSLSKEARSLCCDVLFVPGGSYIGTFAPVVVMSQNLLPFEWSEMIRYGWSLTTMKLLMLRIVQTHSFQKAEGVIFLTKYAEEKVQAVTGTLKASTIIVPHGISERFFINPKPQILISEYTNAKPFRLLYVSIIDQYKHQCNVVEAVYNLRIRGFPVSLDLVGPAYPPSLAKLEKTIACLDPENSWVHYCKAISHDSLHHIYKNADLGVFASTCENLPIILLENMAAGLPVACSDRGPMREILGNAGMYFDPEKPQEISRVIENLLCSSETRASKAAQSYARCNHYTWERCSNTTFSFIVEIAGR